MHERSSFHPETKEFSKRSRMTFTKKVFAAIEALSHVKLAEALQMRRAPEAAG
jgi:hypothetical protein